MYNRMALIIGLALTSLICHPVAGQQKQEPAKQKKSAGKTQGASLTGCVDEQDGHYVLIQDQTRSLMANLEAEGFPIEGFAKHVGHKVTVHGTSNGAERPTFKVRSVETISDSCGPQQ
jgi:hypothetical protein